MWTQTVKNGLVGNTVTITIRYQVETLICQESKTKEAVILKEIISIICALLNSDGGKLVLCDDGKDFSAQRLPFSKLIRKLEQSMISIIGIHQTASKINLQEDEKCIVISVKKADLQLITTNYNFYLPTETQVVQVSSLEPLEKVRDDIIRRKVVPQAVQHGSHCKIFHKHATCGLLESKFNQFKHLKSDQAKRTRLTDRMTGKSNKFSFYVSAFANYQGGHIYYGIRDDGIVEGEFISSEEDMHKITKKVEKTIKKMIWPKLIGQPKRRVQWDIFFEPVIDEDNNAIPSTFVIVIYIAPCLGGVFTEEPECYAIVEGRVQKMSIAVWKRRMLQPIEVFNLRKIPPLPQRIAWGSTRTRRICTHADQLLTQGVNNGKSIVAITKKLEKQFHGLVEIELVILSKQAMICYRSGSFMKARKLLKKYDDSLKYATESQIFDAIRSYIDVALHRASGDLDTLRKILVNALDKAEKIEPGLVTAAIYLLSATVVSLFQYKQLKQDGIGYSVDVLSIRALEHLQYVHDSPIARADMEQKAHITLALFYLGFDISGSSTKKQIDSESLEKAKSSVTAVNKSICEGNPMNRYREIQFDIVKSVLFYRYSQFQLGREESLLQEAFNFAKKAQRVACMYRFEEMLQSARACIAVFTECLVRTHLKPSMKEVDFWPSNPKTKSSKIKQREISTDSEDIGSGSSHCEDDATFPQVATNL